ncbi:hypothetical protein J2787_000790 [Chryseobacterium rhizosphaerae]|uniref:Uncharacterized protein n=1 Tax=Chryseobacterium rhizosphaerae TaxID=395937 RepID=A0AAE3Y7M1_9FLAO|nr:hypothetical protein [Chryseobacterium rhizosphaerae]MDR6525420.1 hypothetical protein [Chryseobacterium rhizosphaerae]
MKKYIPQIILILAVSTTALSCRQNDIMDEPESQIIHNPENRKYFSEKSQDTIRKDINPAADPPIKDTHDWRITENNP